MKTTSDLRHLTSILCLLISVLCPLTSVRAAQREISEAWKVDVGQKQKQAIKFFQAESVQLTETFTQNGRPVDLSGTNTVVVWEINGWSDYTNTYAIATGTVSSASNVVTFSLSPSAANLPTSNYLGFVRALQSDGTNLSQVAVLAYQTIAVEWSPDSRNYNLVAPLTYPPLYTEADWQEITNQVASVEGRVSMVENRTNVWNTAYGWGDHAGLYLTLGAWATQSNLLYQAIANATPGGYATVSNAAVTAYGWGNHSTNGYLTAESDPAWHSGTNTLWGAIWSNLTAIGIMQTGKVDRTDATYTGTVAKAASALQAESDPAFTNWLATTPPLYVQNFDYGAITNPPNLAVYATTGEVAAVSNLAASAQATATNNAAQIAAMPTNPVTSVVINGVTNTPVGGRVDLGTISGGGASSTNAVLYGTLTLTNSTSTAWSVGYWTNSVTGVGTNGVYVRMVYTPAGTTNVYYSLYQ